MGIGGIDNLKPDGSDDWTFAKIQDAYLRGEITLIQAYQTTRYLNGLERDPDPDTTTLVNFRQALWPDDELKRRALQIVEEGMAAS